MLEMGMEPTKIRMSPEMFDNVKEEVHRYIVPGIADDDPADIILDKDGNQIPAGTIFGMEIYIDKRLPWFMGYME